MGVFYLYHRLCVEISSLGTAVHCRCKNQVVCSNVDEQSCFPPPPVRRSNIITLRNAEELQLKQQAQQAKESWHERIHRRRTELEWHRTLSEKIAQSAIDMALYR